MSPSILVDHLHVDLIVHVTNEMVMPYAHANPVTLVLRQCAGQSVLLVLNVP